MSPKTIAPRTVIFCLVAPFTALACALMALSLVGPEVQGSAPVVTLPRGGGHTTRVSDESSNLTLRAQTSADNMANNEVTIPRGVPTRTSFIASWIPVNGAVGYRTDVSTSSSFNTYVDGLRNFDVGNITSHVITGLRPGTTYYYRVRAYNVAGTSADSGTVSA